MGSRKRQGEERKNALAKWKKWHNVRKKFYYSFILLLMCILTRVEGIK